jgi:hypothetical protein
MNARYNILLFIRRAEIACRLKNALVYISETKMRIFSFVPATYVPNQAKDKE